MTEQAVEVLRDVAEDDADPYVIAGWDSRATRPGLPPRSLRAARIVAEALFSREGGPPPSDRLDWLERDLSDFFGHVSLRARLLFRACVATLYWLAPLTSGRFRTMGGLESVEERVKAIEAIERTPLSLTLLGAKAILCIVWFEHPDSAREIGWDQRCRLPLAPDSPGDAAGIAGGES